MRKIFLLFLLLHFIPSDLLAQKEPGKFEVGINITSVLSSFLGNNNGIQATDVPFILRIGKENKLRVGFGINTKSNEFFDPVAGATRISTDSEYLLRIGFQKQIMAENRWSVYWGIDGLAGWQQDRVRAVIFNGENVIDNKQIRFGGGPLLGIGFNISKRIYLSTEASLYGLGILRTDSQSGIGIPEFSRTAFDFEISAVPPLFLYLNCKL